MLWEHTRDCTLSPAMQLACYRIAQAALNNALWATLLVLPSTICVICVICG